MRHESDAITIDSTSPGACFRVLMVSRAPFFGGAEQAALRLACGLQHAGYEMKIVLGCRGVTYQKMTDAGLDVCICPLPNTNKWRALSYARARQTLRRLIREYHPHLVHANDLPTHQIVSDAAKEMNIPRLCHHRFIYSPEAIGWFNKYGAERHLFVSHAFKQQMCDLYPPLKNVGCGVVHDGIELPPIPSAGDRTEARCELELPIDKTIVTFTGQVIERKGVADLIRAWSLLRPDQRDWSQLVIVGDDLPGKGQYLREMIQLSHQLKVEARFTGFRRDVNRWMIASDMVTLPSLAEPLGLTVMEAMAHQRAAIGSDVGGIPEMIQHEHTGLLTTPQSPKSLAIAIGRLIDDPATREQFARRARQRCADHFAIDAHVKQIIVQYAQLLACGNVRRCA